MGHASIWTFALGPCVYFYFSYIDLLVLYIQIDQPKIQLNACKIFIEIGFSVKSAALDLLLRNLKTFWYVERFIILKTFAIKILNLYNTMDALRKSNVDALCRSKLANIPKSLKWISWHKIYSLFYHFACSCKFKLGKFIKMHPCTWRSHL